LRTSAWLPAFRAIAAEIRAAIQPLAGSSRGREIMGVGAGGDHTVYLDSLAEEIAIRHLEEAYRSGLRFRLVSEELGERDFGGREVILVDPIDGSLNAKNGIPYYCVILAAAEGERLDEVTLGFVSNLVSGEEFFAHKGAGAFHAGEPLLRSARPDDGGRFDLIQIDAPSAAMALEIARPLISNAERLRILGSAGLNLCHTATGAIALQVAPVPVRAFDLAGPLLILAESGGVATDLDGAPLHAVSTSLDSRTTVLASASKAVHQRALSLLGRVKV
jgi:myo-inositol-1(or 4)-monophosphatase